MDSETRLLEEVGFLYLTNVKSAVFPSRPAKITLRYRMNYRLKALI
jgi:hypothetical protein